MTGQVGTYLLEDESGKVDDSAIIDWREVLVDKYIRQTKSMFSQDFFIEHISMVHPDLSSYPIPQFLRYRDKMPRLLDKAKKFMQPKDYLYNRLTGEYASDPYTWRGLANLLNPGFHAEILDRIQLRQEMLPTLFQPYDAPGRLLTEIANELCVPHGLPVYLGCNDFFSALIGMGILNDGQCFDVTGTSEHIGRIIDRPADRHSGIIFGPYIHDNVQYGVTACSGSSMDWAFDLFGKNIEQWSDPGNFFDGQKYEPPLFLPYLKGERSPIWDPKARGVFFGINDMHGSAELTYAVLEGVVFSLYQNWTLINDKSSNVIRVAGGAAFDDGLNRIKSSLFQRPFHVLKEKSSGALGAAMSAAVGEGWFDSYEAAAESLVKIDHVILPDERYYEILRSRFDIYNQLYPNLKDLFAQWTDRQ